MRRRVADLSAGVLAVALLTLGGLVVVKPVIDHWDDLYRAHPFEVYSTTKRVEKRRTGEPTEVTITRNQASESSAERMLGNSGLLFLRLALVALAALLAAATLHRVILANYSLRARPVAPPGASANETAYDEPSHPSEDANGARVSTRNGDDAAEEAVSGNLAPAIAMLVTARREELGLSQRELAKRAGVSHTVISRLESGEHTPSPRTIERLTEALNVRL